jgi:hypothetical protein
MDLFLKKSFIFLILLISLNAIIFSFTNYFYNHRYLNNVYLSDKSIFLLSDSHGHSLGENIEKYNVKNLSTPSDSYFDMYRKLVYVSKTCDVKKVYLSVGDHLFTKYRENFNNHERSIFLLNYNDYDNKLKFLYEQVLKRFFVYPSSKQHSFVVNILFKKLKIGKIWIKNNWSDLTSSEKDLQASKRVSQFNFGTKSNLQIQYLKKIINFCKNNNIQLICIKFPLTKEFRTNSRFLKYNYNEITELKSLNIIDYNKIYFDKVEFFKDQDHLNKKGAEEFSKILFSN